jgi:hypothetical protein
MPRTRAQQQGETVEGGWAELPDELVEKVLELLQAAGRSEPQDEGLGFFRATATMRLVCPAWKAVHDAMVKRLVLPRHTTDEAMGRLVRLFPAVVSLEMKGYGVGVLPDAGMRAVSSCTALTSLDLGGCKLVTDDGVRAVSSLPALTFLNLWSCRELTDKGVQAVSSLPALTSLTLGDCGKVTDAGLRALSGLTALTSLDLRYCNKVTAAGVQALRNTTAAPSLHIESRYGSPP